MPCSSTTMRASSSCSIRRCVSRQPSAGYIQAYPPGVRENGGQYSHAGVWALMAQAERGDGDAAYRYFSYLSPAHRSRHPTRGPAYEIEPYVMAGDVYTAPPYVGRGGWSWYTGSAAWMQRAAIESMFGLAHARRRDLLHASPAGRVERRRARARARRTQAARPVRPADRCAGRGAGRRLFGDLARSGRAAALVDAGAGRVLPDASSGGRAAARVNVAPPALSYRRTRGAPMRVRRCRCLE